MPPVRPIVVISRCIDFDACRYNGQVIRASLREELEPHMELRPICPELEIGLGVPRDPVRLVRSGAGARMVQPSTGRDLTRAMETFSRDYLDTVADADGFILKSRSPSCGIRNAKRFHSEAEDAGHDSGPGLFTARVLERFPHAAVEDEGRLNDLRLRDHFLTKLWALSAFRVAAAGGAAQVVDFHTRNKLLLMAHNQTRARELGRLVATAGGAPPEQLTAEYRRGLGAALGRPSRPGNNVNVLMHALGHVSERLSGPERSHFLATLDAYREGRVPLSAAQAIVGAWAARFEVPYLAQQTFFAPYPAALVRLERPRRRGAA
ncbi:MAG TPA: DUF523 and DUF1722 domain-containing protein [Solirubrobacterales bacterium]|nr:DUF523 and DUF1722 domain-containing protein [Solirubrobacterales bacterium]